MKAQRFQINRPYGAPFDARFSILPQVWEGVHQIHVHARGGGKSPTNSEYAQGLRTLCHRLVAIQPVATISRAYIDTKNTRGSGFDWRADYRLLPPKMCLAEILPGELTGPRGDKLSGWIKRSQRKLGSNETRAITIELKISPDISESFLVEYLSLGPAASDEVFGSFRCGAHPPKPQDPYSQNRAYLKADWVGASALACYGQGPHRFRDLLPVNYTGWFYKVGSFEWAHLKLQDGRTFWESEWNYIDRVFPDNRGES